MSATVYKLMFSRLFCGETLLVFYDVQTTDGCSLTVINNQRSCVTSLFWKKSLIISFWLVPSVAFREIQLLVCSRDKVAGHVWISVVCWQLIVVEVCLQFQSLMFSNLFLKASAAASRHSASLLTVSKVCAPWIEVITHFFDISFTVDLQICSTKLFYT